LEATDGIEIMLKPGDWIPWTKFNSINSPFSDLRLRQALILCLDMDECMLAAAGGNEDLYELGHSLFFENQAWYSDAGSEWYNQNDDARAKELLEEAGYNGEELVWVVTQDYSWMYDVAVVVQQQAEEIGMNIVLEVYDWTTCVSMLQNGQKEKDWDLWTTGFSYPDIVDPTAIDSLFTLDTIWPYESEEMDAIVKRGHSADMEVRVEAYHDLVEQWYADMYGIIYGKLSAIGGYSSDVEVCQQYTNLRFFNCFYK
jgi:peptide/nickel transport system substrate-binding protein